MTDPITTPEQAVEAAALYHDRKVTKWRKEARRHTRTDGRRSDYEEDDLERAKRHEIDAAAIRALRSRIPASGEGYYADRRAVNTVLAELLSPLMPDLPERIRVGNDACNLILAELGRAPTQPAGDAIERARKDIERAIMDYVASTGDRAIDLSALQFISNRIHEIAEAALSALQEPTP